MNKKQKILVIALVVILVGSLIYLFISMNDSDSSEVTNTQSTGDTTPNKDEIESASQKQFNPIATTDQAFTVELESEDASNDITYNGKVSYDGEGNFLLEGKVKEDQIRFYDIDGEFISCQNDTCYSLASGENGVDTSTYAYTEETIENYKNNAEYVGRSDCPAGTCDTWNITTEDGTNITLYVADDGKISKSEGTINDSSFVAVFSYEPVTITAPDNVLPSPF